MPITIDQEYGWAIASAAAIAVQCLFTSFVAGGARRKIFNQEFMQKHFGEEHKKHFKEDIKVGGYPDMGNGRYAAKLDYKDWYDFNNRQRAHYNFLEQVGVIIPLLLIAAVAFPTVAGYAGWAYFVGRLIYTVGYVGKGPNGRLIGVLILDIGLLALIILSMLSCFKIITGAK